MATTVPQEPQKQVRTFAEFLETSPPDVQEEVSDLVAQYGNNFVLTQPQLALYCASDTCNGIRIFESTRVSNSVSNDWSFDFVRYVCRNCKRKTKTYALAVRKGKENQSGSALKLGESPPFGPLVPARVITLIGPDREIFLRGRRAENQGLGIGAFAYYRRVVENQKGRIIGEMGRVAKRLGADEEALEAFERAVKETQFTTAIDQIKTAIPKSLLIEGHNPLTLLHTALSEGLHDRPDEECLELASSIRLVLTDLAERIGQALKDDAELKDAVSRLLNRNANKPEPANSSLEKRNH
jgi:hypothetical protein